MSPITKAVKSSAISSVPESVMTDVGVAVDYIAAIPGITQIWLFGSAAGKRRRDWRSDLDFAVQGLPFGKEYQTWSELDEKLSHALDLVRCEDASPLLLSEIQKGILLYEA